jgi:hypothetical protein
MSISDRMSIHAQSCKRKCVIIIRDKEIGFDELPVKNLRHRSLKTYGVVSCRFCVLCLDIDGGLLLFNVSQMLTVYVSVCFMCR